MIIPVYNLKAEKVSEMDFVKYDNVKVSVPLLHEVVVSYLANQRSGTASTKTRGEISGGGIKPWKQKGTGRARAGSTRSGLWRHGGVIFGPKPKSYRVNLPHKKLHNAISMSIKSKLAENKVSIMKDLAVPEPKTKIMVQLLKKLNVDSGRVLIVVDKIDTNLKLASRNINNLKLLTVNSLNAYDIINADNLILNETVMNNL